MRSPPFVLTCFLSLSVHGGVHRKKGEGGGVRGCGRLRRTGTLKDRKTRKRGGEEVEGETGSGQSQGGFLCLLPASSLESGAASEREQ